MCYGLSCPWRDDRLVTLFSRLELQTFIPLALQSIHLHPVATREGDFKPLGLGQSRGIGARSLGPISIGVPLASMKMLDGFLRMMRKVLVS